MPVLRSSALVPVVLSTAIASAGELAPGVELLPGRFVAGSQPDGNTVVFTAPGGLVVVDTGRHADHAQAILDLAGRAATPVAAVVNTHWHLDHAGGNRLLRAAYPQLEVWSSRAVEQALTGFLATYRAQLAGALDQADEPAARGRLEAELAIVDAGPALLPDRPVEAGGPHTIAGRPFELGLERRAVTAGDVWLLDPASGVLVAGDLVTLPAPLLDTACPRGWQEALGRLASTRFTLLVPGHGPAMSRADFDRYRAGFDHLLACAASDSSDDACVAGWLADLGPLVPASERDLARTLLATYLPNHLRAPETVERLCGGG